MIKQRGLEKIQKNLLQSWGIPDKFLQKMSIKIVLIQSCHWQGPGVT